jgi:hypothetical protein
MLAWGVWGSWIIYFTHLSQGSQKMKVYGLSVSEDLKDSIQVHLIFTETPWRNQNSDYFLMFKKTIKKSETTNPSPLLQE